MSSGAPGRTLLRLRRWLRPPRLLKVTPLGRTYLVVTVGVGLGALNTGNNLLYLVLGLLLSSIVVSGILSERFLRGLEVRRLGVDLAFAQEDFPFRWVVRAGRSTAYALTVSEEGAGLAGRGQVALVPAGEERVVRGDLRASARGPLSLTEVRVSTLFPLGLFSKSRIFELPGELLVLPRRMPAFDLGALESPQSSPGAPSSQGGTGGEGDLAGLVEVREGEDARRVHWVKSAALGRLVRPLREREAQQVYLLRIPPGLESSRADSLCEQAAAQARHLLGLGHAVGLESGALRLRPEPGGPQERRLLVALARVGFPSGRAPSLGFTSGADPEEGVASGSEPRGPTPSSAASAPPGARR